METCYYCGEQFDGRKVIMHKEHILQNAIWGRLKADNILCESCGTKLSEEVDTKFVKLFAPFTMEMAEILINRDRKDKRGGKIRGKFFDGLCLELDVSKKKESISVFQTLKDGKKAPFYFVDDEKRKVKIYGPQKVTRKYDAVVKKELIQSGSDISNYQFLHCESLDLNGWFEWIFSDNLEKVKFNRTFSLGLAKIAVGFAVKSGVDRKALAEIFDFQLDGHAVFKEEIPIIPYYPFGILESRFELRRLEFDAHFPSHTLSLFIEKYHDGIQRLFVFIELFSTFQYYVPLNLNYKGPEIEASYCQILKKKQIPKIDFDRLSPSDFFILKEELQIKDSELHGKSYEEQKGVISEYLNKEPETYEFSIGHFVPTLEKVGENPIYALVGDTELSKMRRLQLELFDLADSPENTFRRKYWEVDENGQSIQNSNPERSYQLAIEDPQSLRKYTFKKFQDLEQFASSTPSKPAKPPQNHPPHTGNTPE